MLIVYSCKTCLLKKPCSRLLLIVFGIVVMHIILKFKSSIKLFVYFYYNFLLLNFDNDILNILYIVCGNSNQMFHETNEYIALLINEINKIVVFSYNDYISHRKRLSRNISNWQWLKVLCWNNNYLKLTCIY